MDLSEMVRMADKTDKMIAIVRDTMDYYGSNPDRRAYIQHDDGISCAYFVDAWAGRPERMCAVGRCLIDPAGIQRRFSSMGAMQLDGEFSHGLDDVLKPEYRGLPIDFWDQLQCWHDDRENFDAIGLTEAGKEEGEWLIRKIENGDL